MEKRESLEPLSSSSPADNLVDIQQQDIQASKPLPRRKWSEQQLPKQQADKTSSSTDYLQGINQQNVQAPKPLPRLKRSQQQPLQQKTIELADSLKVIQQKHIQCTKPLSQDQQLMQQALEFQPKPLPRTNWLLKQQNKSRRPLQHKIGASEQDSNLPQPMQRTNGSKKQPLNGTKLQCKQQSKALESRPNITAVMEITLKKLQKTSKNNLLRSILLINILRLLMRSLERRP
ncbi:hypothetical protein HELRODRAFT_178523 [Helobdella robusta]|uniref:Uncharacterized protein n=1 Tax=Helobdella robusta TaxID=6412 RepID=T1FDA9_HELRO|nr:hypothetical protein HELRODRAFT_178523 [Helobdella robusta]ESN97074.1 hypothetical protein HELRODRAFT_178523 [Helobdella robusta]